jgi:uncharacterized membrane protein YbhN (UPF0104 family)
LRKKISNTLKFLVFLLAGILLLWMAFRNISFTSLKEGLKQAKYSWVMLSALFSVLAYMSRTRRWILLINPLGYNPSFANTFNSMMSGYLANLALPRIGELSRCIVLGKREKIPADQLFGTVIVERTIDFLSLLVLMIFVMIFIGNTIVLFLREHIFIPLQEKLASVFGSAVLFWIIVLSSSVLLLFLIFRFREKLKSFRFFERLFFYTAGVVNGLKTITRLERKWEFMMHTVFIWINFILMTWVMVFSVKSTSGLDLSAGLILLVIGGLAMAAPIQAGVGAFHYAISRVLWILYGVSLEDGMVYAILAHESQIILTIVIGVFSAVMILRDNKVRNSA